MKKRGKKVIGVMFVTVSLAISAFFIPWNLLSMRLSPLPDTVQAEIENSVSQHGLDGVIAYIDEAGEVSTYSAGYNDRDEKTKADPDSLFKIASISKLYMAVAAAKLIDEGNLSLDDTLSRMLPEYQDDIQYADEITLQMLIQHRSGIPNFVDDPNFSWNNLPTNVDDALALILGEDANFKPDARYQYSNTNYLLLAKIMDDSLGYPHNQYINDKILIPLQLNDTYYYYSEVNPEDVMSGYYVGYEPDLKPSDYFIPGGSMVASITDVGVFIRALNDGILLTDSEEEIYSEIYVYEHTGLIPGYQSIAKYDVESDRVIIIFINTSGVDSWGKMEIMYKRIVRISANN
ncbi:Putative D-alanyl-D-alanine carboxypeptidase [Candidatus Lokiarchaeum ossiferum]|uniref:D-alanyl-D-alanine carboxypeptidase n=1 Tax=Candidatus Lokiarchaeum ossiferum TaxID=2951803 RepID=A0ABY6HTR9_9ARCH|nr:Putative D-alanyl-D-alanine carboxypeptidase [Candidatus Lokiarchaeum sp. B-35]